MVLCGLNSLRDRWDKCVSTSESSPSFADTHPEEDSGKVVPCMWLPAVLLVMTWKTIPKKKYNVYVCLWESRIHDQRTCPLAYRVSREKTNSLVQKRRYIQGISFPGKMFLRSCRTWWRKIWLTHLWGHQGTFISHLSHSHTRQIQSGKCRLC